VFENRVLRRIFGPKRDEMTGDWGKLHIEELHNLDFSSSVITMIESRRMKWAGNVARMEKRNAYTILVGKPEGKRPLGRSRRKCTNNIKTNFRGIGLVCMNLINQVQDREEWRALVNMVMNLRVP
jgi:hypothetical protein